MKRLVPAGISMILGVGIGAGAVVTSSRLRAQSQVGDGTARLVITPAEVSGRWVSSSPTTWVGKTPPLRFIKDTKSGGCWIGEIRDKGVFFLFALGPPAPGA